MNGFFDRPAITGHHLFIGAHRRSSADNRLYSFAHDQHEKAPIAKAMRAGYQTG
ncbi:hypothetical protein SAJA_05955 [Salinisphaera japonica YTM-1]|uniref:Uncharacterized protein n=1 Tax=Salinisphaera japonica YTM-1 TaxID=1209778 RepID=A0A423PW39_9GAMM|nr:hypothetical protein SAJA_05955 [Salinisphaera japonica YTM-1]